MAKIDEFSLYRVVQVDSFEQNIQGAGFTSDSPLTDTRAKSIANVGAEHHWEQG